MAYAPIIKLEKFTSEKDNTQIWLNDNNMKALQAISYFLQDTTNSWYQSLVTKPQTFQEFKVAFLGYFSNNNSINCLVNTFTTIKQKENEAVITYLECFYKNLRQIQAIQADYFTVPQILNQFIRGLYIDLQATIINARNFEATELEANYAHTVNLENGNRFQNQSRLASSLTNQQWQQEMRACHYCVTRDQLISIKTLITNYKLRIISILTKLPIYDAANISNPNDAAIILTSNLSAFSINLSTAVPTHLSAATEITTTELEIIDDSLSTDFHLLVTPKDTLPNNTATNQKQLITSNILPATVTNDKLLTTIFLFELEKTTPVPLFSEAALDTKPITTMYTNMKVDGHAIKLILNSESAGSIITRQLMDQLCHRVDQAAINGIITPIKVLVIEAIQYQALLEEKEKKPTWEAYQVSWANENHNKLLSILSWDEPEKGKQREKLIWETDNLTWTDNNKPTSNWE
ncbi:hypothetical protein G9A89_021589 [Geosiphon pyriformis]|nr:hypothetical protein G9A89_021589 [Geosiphon pyriformis]